MWSLLGAREWKIAKMVTSHWPRCCSYFMWSLLGAREWKIAKMVTIHWPRWTPCPSSPGCFVAESLHKSSGTGDLPKLLKWWSYIDVWPFYDEVKFASVCICLGPIHLYGKNVVNFKWLLWSLRANAPQISCVASLGQGNKRLLKWSWSIDLNGCHAHIW